MTGVVIGSLSSAKPARVPTGNHHLSPNRAISQAFRRFEIRRERPVPLTRRKSLILALKSPSLAAIYVARLSLSDRCNRTSYGIDGARIIHLHCRSTPLADRGEPLSGSVAASPRGT